MRHQESNTCHEVAFKRMQGSSLCRKISACMSRDHVTLWVTVCPHQPRRVHSRRYTKLKVGLKPVTSRRASFHTSSAKTGERRQLELQASLQSAFTSGSLSSASVPRAALSSLNYLCNTTQGASMAPSLWSKFLQVPVGKRCNIGHPSKVAPFF